MADGVDSTYHNSFDNNSYVYMELEFHYDAASGRFSPHHAIDVIRITHDDPDDFFRDVGNIILPDQPKRSLRAPGLAFQDGDAPLHVPPIQTHQHDGPLLHPLRTQDLP